MSAVPDDDAAGQPATRATVAEHPLRPLLWPRSIAIVGASSDLASLSGRPLAILKQYGYRGAIYPVNPARSVIEGLRVYDRVTSVPTQVDLALVTVPASRVLEVLRDCAAAEVRFAVIFSSGFGEMRDPSGSAAQREIRELAQATGMRISGPNSEGFLNVVGRIPASFSPAADYDHGLTKLLDGEVAVVSQSGGLGFAVFHTAQESGLGFSYVITVGNEVDVDSLDFTEFLIADDNTRVIVLLVEGLSQPRRLAMLAAAAAERGKYIVVAKLGRSSAGARAAESHTAHIAGADESYRAAFARYGVLQVDDPDELVDASMALTRAEPAFGRRVAILTSSGGAGVWLTDACEAAGLIVAPLSDALQDTLRERIPTFGSATNPVDMTAQVVQDKAIAELLDLIANSGEADVIVLISSLVGAAALDDQRDGLARAAAMSPVPILVYTYTTPSPGSIALMRDIGLPWYPTPRRAARAVSMLAQVGERQGRSRTGSTFEPASLVTHAAKLVKSPIEDVNDEYGAKRLLREWGLAVPAGELVQSRADAIAAAGRLGFPVALKMVSPDVAHKTDVGGLALGISSAEQVGAEYDGIVERVRSRLPGARVTGVLVERMAEPGLEYFVGVLGSREFGPVIVFGTGGVSAELRADQVVELAPLDRELAGEMIRRVPAARLLDEFRGIPPADRVALEDLLVSVSAFALNHADALASLDLNPVMVHPAGRGVTVVDAWITWWPES